MKLVKAITVLGIVVFSGTSNSHEVRRRRTEEGTTIMKELHGKSPFECEELEKLNFEKIQPLNRETKWVAWDEIGEKIIVNQ